MSAGSINVSDNEKSISEPSILAIIPARAGSKGLPNKNILDCGGKPLIAWTIEAARHSKFISRVLVSTDCKKTAEISRKSGAWVPFLRDPELARDDSSIIDVVRDVLFRVKSLGENYDYIALLQPTSPLRDTQHINKAIEDFLSNSKNGTEALVSVKKMDEKMHWIMARNLKSGYLYTLSGLDMTNPRRQELPECFIPNGAIYLTKSESFDGFYGAHTIPFVMDEQSSLDIDYKDDLSKANEVLNKR